MEIKIDDITLDVRFSYEYVCLVREENETYKFVTTKEIAYAIESLMAKVKTICTFGDTSCSVICPVATTDLSVEKKEGRKRAFGKTVIAYCGPDKQKRKKFWDDKCWMPDSAVLEELAMMIWNDVNLDYDWVGIDGQGLCLIDTGGDEKKARRQLIVRRTDRCRRRDDKKQHPEYNPRHFDDVSDLADYIEINWFDNKLIVPMAISIPMGTTAKEIYNLITRV